jgi:hypothetical protein
MHDVMMPSMPVAMQCLQAELCQPHRTSQNDGPLTQPLSTCQAEEVRAIAIYCAEKKPAANRQPLNVQRIVHSNKEAQIPEEG